jgi:hypothetical protein
VLYNAVLSLASSGRDNDDMLMEIGSAAAQTIANGTIVLLVFFTRETLVLICFLIARTSCVLYVRPQ